MMERKIKKIKSEYDEAWREAELRFIIQKWKYPEWSFTEKPKKRVKS
ncbi:MAG: hypothetical protein ABH874_07970 [Methanobacteriota archaeon]